jgi:hypothetical protein
MSDSRKKKKEKVAARKLSRQPVPEWRREVRIGSDRIVAILAVANLEALLAQTIEQLLDNHDDDTMDRLHGPEGPLSTFFSKIELAYALGVVSDATDWSFISSEIYAICLRIPHP